MATLRRALVSLAAATAAWLVVGAALRGAASAPTRCPDQATGPASEARPLLPGGGAGTLAGRGSRR